MANLKGSGKGGRKRIYGDLPLQERMKISRDKSFKDKRKINFLMKEEEYQRLIRLEEESGYKFHADFLTHLMDVFESTLELRKVLLQGRDGSNELL